MCPNAICCYSFLWSTCARSVRSCNRHTSYQSSSGANIETRTNQTKNTDVIYTLGHGALMITRQMFPLQMLQIPSQHWLALLMYSRKRKRWEAAPPANTYVSFCSVGCVPVLADSWVSMPLESQIKQRRVMHYVYQQRQGGSNGETLI
jgi:hypothetical protein